VGRRRLLKWISITLASLLAIILALAFAIGPGITWELLSHGTTTVWDHLEYPTRSLDPSPENAPWPTASDTDMTNLPHGPGILEVLETGESLAFLVIHDGQVIGEWYREDHGPETPSMLFSASKSILSLMIGAAVDDGLIASVADPVTDYVPELNDGGFDRVALADLLRMDSSMDYVEDDNPFGIHIPFNYTRDLRGAILDLEVRDEPDPGFRYKSGDNALLGLVLERALGGESLTAYLERRLWDPLGAANTGSWNVDDEGGFERTWCCLAMTARDLARFGQLVAQDGEWGGEELISAGWVEASLAAGFSEGRWPADYSGSPLVNYGYQWWLLDDGSALALGKAGQYLYVDRDDDIVIVRLGEDQGDVLWIDLIQGLADSL
jgi:CubicO group peptidase (beta-lactamase class C family)